MDASEIISTGDLVREVGVSRAMLGKWGREGLEVAAKIRHGKWHRERALSWISDRREDSPNLDGDGPTSGDLAKVRIRLYSCQADGQELRNQIAEASLVYRDTAQHAFSEQTGEQISAGDAWARDASTPACKPLMAHVSASVALSLKAELWNELRQLQADAVRRVAGALAVGEDVGSARIRISDEWADNCRIMPPGSPFPGKWDTNRTPYLRAPMRAFADPSVDVVVAIMRRQRGKTELGANCLGWMWDTCPAPSLWINPTETLARSFAQDRVRKMFSTIDGLSDRTREKRPGALEKFVDGIRFGIGWAGSRTETASHPAKFAIIDERSRMTENIGGEGDPVRIVQAGGGMYPGATSLIISSPTEEGVCPTFDWWAQGTKMRWCWRCPGCGEWYVPCLATAKFPEKAEYLTIREEACIACPACEHELRDGELEDVEADYVPSTIDDEGTITLRPGMDVRNSVASYWVTGLSDQITHIGHAMEAYARAARNGKPADLQANVNAVHGELWKVPAERLQSDSVRERMVPDIPADDIQLVTVGVDVQADRIYYAVRGWCYLQTSYGLDHGCVLGSTDYDDVWMALARALDTTFVEVAPKMVLVDSGHETAMVYQQCRRHPRWAPARGRPTMDRPYRDSLVDESVSGRSLKTLRLWLHCVDTWQTWLNGRIKWPFGEPGAWYVPAGVDDVYCEQVVNQACRVRGGKREWFATGTRDDHYRDCELLAAIAADIQGVRRLREPKKPEPPAPRPPRPPAYDRWARQTL